VTLICVPSFKYFALIIRRAKFDCFFGEFVGFAMIGIAVLELVEGVEAVVDFVVSEFDGEFVMKLDLLMEICWISCCGFKGS
jgi:hypothetical protein